MLAGELRPGGRGDRGNRDVEERVGVRAQVQAGVSEVPPVVLEGDRLVVAQQAHDDVGPLGEQLAGLALVEPDHGRVGRQRARSEAEHEPAAGQMVEQDGPLGHPQRVVVADADHAGAELDVARSLGRGRDEDLGRGDDLGARRVVLADPGLVPPEAVEVLDQLEIALERQCRVLARRMERCHEDAEPQTVRHRIPLVRITQPRGGA